MKIFHLGMACMPPAAGAKPTRPPSVKTESNASTRLGNHPQGRLGTVYRNQQLAGTRLAIHQPDRNHLGLLQNISRDATGVKRNANPVSWRTTVRRSRVQVLRDVHYRQPVIFSYSSFFSFPLSVALIFDNSLASTCRVS